MGDEVRRTAVLLGEASQGTSPVEEGEELRMQAWEQWQSSYQHWLELVDFAYLSADTRHPRALHAERV